MAVRQVAAHDLVADNTGKRALSCGPLVYAVEAVDVGAAWANLSLGQTDTCSLVWQPDLLGGVNTIRWGLTRRSPTMPGPTAAQGR